MILNHLVVIFWIGCPPIGCPTCRGGLWAHNTNSSNTRDTWSHLHILDIKYSQKRIQCLWPELLMLSTCRLVNWKIAVSKRNNCIRYCECHHDCLIAVLIFCVLRKLKCVRVPYAPWCWYIYLHLDDFRANVDLGFQGPSQGSQGTIHLAVWGFQAVSIVICLKVGLR